MSTIRVLAVLLLVAVLAGGALAGRDALQVATGYSAKQMCSGVFVAGLPQEFLRERDIAPTMAMLGPLRGLLRVRARPGEGDAVASLFGARARAVHRAGQGCSLHLDGRGDPPLPPPAVASTVARVPPALSAAVERAFSEPEGGGRNTLALLVSQGGELLLERYAPPVTAATRLQGWSMNKSLMVTWIHLQVRRGGLDPSQPVAALLAGEEAAAALEPSLTLSHLTQMESGLDFVEMYGPGSDVTRMLYRSEAMWQVPAARPQEHPPGSHFAYSSGDTVLASYLWQRSLDVPYAAWIERHFATPLGIESLVAEADASGVQVGSSFSYMSARDWLRAGQLWLDAWHGRSPLVERDWMRDAVSPRPSDERGRYGRGFWLNTGGVSFHGVPESLFYASGHNGQYVIVVPEWELVVVRLGLTHGGTGSGVGEFLRALAAERGLAL